MTDPINETAENPHDQKTCECCKKWHRDQKLGTIAIIILALNIIQLGYYWERSHDRLMACLKQRTSDAIFHGEAYPTQKIRYSDSKADCHHQDDGHSTEGR